MLTKRTNSPSWLIGTLLIAVPVALPIVVLVGAALAPSGESWSHMRDTVLGLYFINTLVLMALVAVFAASIGITTAWLTVQYNFPLRRLLVPVLALPLAAPAYVIGYVYADLLEFSGPVQTLIRQWFDLPKNDALLPNIRSLPGASLVMALVLYPYIYLLARGSFVQQSGALHEAARALGASRRVVFWRVGLPVAWPALMGGLALVLMETVADYGVVEHFGVPTLTTGIFRTWFAMGEPAAALQLAGWLFMLVCVLVVAEQFARRGQRFNPLTRQSQAVPYELRGWQAWVACGLCLTPVLLGLVLPLLALFAMTLTAGETPFSGKFMALIGNSVWVASAAALVCAAAALWLAYAERLYPQRLVRGGVRVATLGYAVPGLVLAVALMLPMTSFDKWIATALRDVLDIRWGLLLTGTSAALIFVYVARFLTVAFNSTQAGLIQIHPQLDAAARSLGHSPGSVLRRVHLPLLRPAILTGLLLVFIDVMKELPATLILRPFNFETLATWVYRYASDERLAEASTAALAIVLVSLVPTVMLSLSRREGTD
jgi:iron(III) transport system permease protein